MNWRSYNEKNICKETGDIFPTYFYTKKDAIAHQAKFGGVIEKNICGHWVAYKEVNGKWVQDA